MAATKEDPAKRAARLAAMRAKKALMREQGTLKKEGRPKGVLNRETILKIQSRESFVSEVSKRAGIITDDLMRNSAAGDTRAGLGLLDRIGIAPVQKVEGEIKFSLSALGRARETIDGNADVISVDAPRDAEHAAQDALEVPSQVE